MQLLGVSDGGLRRFSVGVEGRLLMRILAVAQILNFLELKTDLIGQALFSRLQLLRKIFGDPGIICGRMCERPQSLLLPMLSTRRALVLAQIAQNLLISIN